MKRLLFKKALCLALLALCLGTIRAQNAVDEEASPREANGEPFARNQPETARQEGPSPLNHFELEVLLSNKYDTNIDHNEEHVPSYGLVPGLRLRYRNRPSDPLLIVIYTVARHAYTNTEKWDRVSNKVRVLFAPELTRRLHAESVGEISLRGSSEDRDLSNQYFFRQGVEYRFTRNHRLQLYGTLLWKQIPENTKNNAFKPRLGARFERRLPEGRRWEAGVRYERNREQLPRGNYARWTFDMGYRFPLFDTGGRVQVELKYRRKTYEARFVEIEDEDVLRRDYRWVLGASWRRTFVGHAQVELGYQFETRDSNDPEKHFTAHLITLALAYRL
ncbi:MAG: hypothetical protein ACE5G0_11170 [Rhodothermales bacterium]